MNPIERPLAGLTVLDFTQFIAGPVATRIMGELGAEVIKVELAPGGDLARVLPTIRDGRSAYYAQHNVGKKSLCLDVRKSEALDLLKRLVTKVEVLVENFSPGAIARIGLGWDVVRGINPRLLMCSISAFGQSGPLSSLKGFDHIAQSYSGVTSMIGDPDAPPSLPGVAIGDVGTGITALAAINAALYRQARHGGPGQWLDIALIDFYFQAHEINVQVASTSGGAVRPTRTGSHNPVVAPLGVFRGKQGYITLVAIGEQFRRVAEAMGMPDLANDPRFLSNDLRKANQTALTALIEAWMARQDSDAAILDKLVAAGVPAAPVLTVEQAMRHPHLIERGTVRAIADPVFGSFQAPGQPVRLGPPVDPGPAPFLGQHNGEVLTRYLGLDARAIARLTKSGVLHAVRV